MSLADLPPNIRDLVNGCMEWKKTSDEFKKHGLYAGEDESAIGCFILKKLNKAEVRVGSAVGHMTHVYWNSKKELEYHDADDDVNRVMKELFEDAGARCKLTDYGVWCDLSSVDDLNEIFRRMAAATSMDFRLQNPGRYWRWAPIPPECEGLRGEEFEICAVKGILEKVE